MNDLKSLSEILNLLAAHPFFIYDYADGLYIDTDSAWIYSIELEDESLASYDSLAASELIRQLDKILW